MARVGDEGLNAVSSFVEILERDYGARGVGDDFVGVGPEVAHGFVEVAAAGDDEFGAFDFFGDVADDGAGGAFHDEDAGGDVHRGDAMFDGFDHFAAVFAGGFAAGAVVGRDGAEDGELAVKEFGDAGGAEEEFRGPAEVVDGEDDVAVRPEGFEFGRMRVGPDGALDVVEDLGGDGADEEAAHGAVAAGGHHDEAGGKFFGAFDDFLGDAAGGDAHVACFGVEVAFPKDFQLLLALDFEAFAGGFECDDAAFAHRGEVAFRRAVEVDEVGDDAEQTDARAGGFGETGDVAGDGLAGFGKVGGIENVVEQLRRGHGHRSSRGELGTRGARPRLERRLRAQGDGVPGRGGRRL